MTRRVFLMLNGWIQRKVDWCPDYINGECNTLLLVDETTGSPGSIKDLENVDQQRTMAKGGFDR